MAQYKLGINERVIIGREEEKLLPKHIVTNNRANLVAVYMAGEGSAKHTWCKPVYRNILYWNIQVFIRLVMIDKAVAMKNSLSGQEMDYCLSVTFHKKNRAVNKYFEN